MLANVIAVDQNACAGGIVFWRLEGALDLALVAPVWAEGGLAPELLPEPPAPATALARAVRELQKGRVLVRPLADKRSFAVVRERAVGEELSHGVELRVRLNAAGRPEFNMLDGGHTLWGEVHASEAERPMISIVRAAYDRHLAECSPEDVGPWLVKLVLRHVDGVSLRDGGGIYYVPPQHLATWRRIAGALARSTSHRTFEIPAMRTSEAVASILDAVEQEASREFEAMMAEVGSVGSRAIDSRFRRVESVEAKCARYEELLGARLDGMRERVEELRAALSAARLRALADEEKRWEARP